MDRDDIERVRHATDLIELVQGVTTVRRQGRTFMAVCPFHQEKTPSMSLDKARGLYHCFGCGEGGDVFKFVMETQGLGFNEAVEWLAAPAGITVRRDPGAAKRQSERQEMIQAVREAIRFYQDRLKHGTDSGHARSYVRSRGYGVDVIDQFEIGYSPEEWDLLTKHLRAQGVRDKVMIGAGLARRGRGGKLYDQFRGRIMFPIRDMRSDPVGFGARLLRGEGAKYLNSPETRLYQKAKLLYGLDRAKSDISRAGYAVVVEGYTDVIALHLADYPRAVATCGTALGEDHFDLLRRFADRIVLAFDADSAGAGAAIRGDELRLPADLGLDLRVAVMPDGLDPAELVQQGRVTELRAAVDQSSPMLQFRIERELGEHNLAEPEDRARAIRAVVPLIARQADPLARREYARFVARETGTELEPVLDAVERTGRSRRPEPESPPPPVEVPTELTGRDRAEQELLRVLLANEHDLAGRVNPELFERPAHREAAVRLLEIDTPIGTLLDISRLEEDALAGLIRRLALTSDPLADAEALIDRLERYRMEDRITELRRTLADLDPSDHSYSDIFQELIALERAKRQGPDDRDAK